MVGLLDSILSICSILSIQLDHISEGMAVRDRDGTVGASEAPNRLVLDEILTPLCRRVDGAYMEYMLK